MGYKKVWLRERECVCMGAVESEWVRERESKHHKKVKCTGRENVIWTSNENVNFYKVSFTYFLSFQLTLPVSYLSGM